MTGKDYPRSSCSHVMVKLGVLAGRKINLKRWVVTFSKLWLILLRLSSCFLVAFALHPTFGMFLIVSVVCLCLIFASCFAFLYVHVCMT